MIGHYPPICYPSAGWVADPVEREADVHLDAGGLDLPVRLYRFRRIRDRGQEDRITIFNAFVLPGGTVTREISDINRQSERRSVSVRGVAQLQIIAPAGIDRAAAMSAAGELLGAMAGVLDALQVGEEEGGDP